LLPEELISNRKDLSIIIWRWHSYYRFYKSKTADDYHWTMGIQ